MTPFDGDGVGMNGTVLHVPWSSTLVFINQTANKKTSSKTLFPFCDYLSEKNLEDNSAHLNCLNT